MIEPIPMNKLKKSIQFAFPGSENAKLLGFEAEGCYYIEYTRYSTSPCLQAGGFPSVDKDLMDSYYEADGEAKHFSPNLYPHGI